MAFSFGVKPLKKQVTVTISYEPGKENESIQDVNCILSNLTPSEISVLAKLSKNPALKAMALNAAKKYI